MLKRISITIGASDVAACIGLNPYKSQDDMMKTIMSKYFPKKGIKTNTEKAVELLATSDIGTQINLDIYNQAGNIKTSVMNDIVKDAADTLENVFQGEDKKIVLDYLQSKANTTHGIRNEDKTAQSIVENGLGTKLIEDHTFHRFTLYETEKYKFHLVGRIDRLDVEEDGTTTLIEIKNRVNRLFNCVKEYEHIQIQTYLHLLDLEKANLIEQYRDQSSMNAFPIERTRELWNNTILPGLVAFCMNVEEVA